MGNGSRNEDGMRESMGRWGKVVREREEGGRK